MVSKHLLKEKHSYQTRLQVNWKQVHVLMSNNLSTKLVWGLELPVSSTDIDAFKTNSYRSHTFICPQNVF